MNRGDSFRRRRSRSNSLIPTPTTPDPQQGGNNGAFTSEDGLLMPANLSSRANSRNNSRRSSRASPNQTPNQSPRPSIVPQPPSPTGPTTHYRVAMIGGRGVGKSALISQFLTSDSINAYDGQDGRLIFFHQSIHSLCMYYTNPANRAVRACQQTSWRKGEIRVAFCQHGRNQRSIIFSFERDKCYLPCQLCLHVTWQIHSRKAGWEIESTVENDPQWWDKKDVECRFSNKWC